MTIPEPMRAEAMAARATVKLDLLKKKAEKLRAALTETEEEIRFMQGVIESTKRKNGE